jgi:hypothetical protein
MRVFADMRVQPLHLYRVRPRRGFFERVGTPDSLPELFRTSDSEA